MTKFSPEKRKYYKIGVSGYIGAGNNINVFTRRPKPSFSKLKQIYGEHLEDFKVNDSTHKDRKKISNELREKIKANARKDYKRFIRNQIIIALISLIIVFLMILIVWKIILYFYSDLK